MVNYSQGKVYKLEPIKDGIEGDVYFGSTCQYYLSSRLQNHRVKFRKYKKTGIFETSSHILFDKYGIDNIQIILLDTLNCSNKYELLNKEAHYIKNNKCINKRIPLRTQKEYNEVNKEYFKMKQKEYITNNKEKRQNYENDYYNKNKIDICLKSKKYRENNEEKVKINKSRKILCICGLEISNGGKSIHYKTKKHLKLLNEKNVNT